MFSVVEQEPFKHCHAQGIVATETESALLSWLEGIPEWRHKVESFYEHYGLDLASVDQCDASALLCSRPYLFVLKKWMEDWFDVKLSSNIRIWAHWLRPGNGIGVHNDNTPGEFRFVLQLNSGWDISHGGLTLLASGKKPLKIEKAIPPISNTALAFRTDALSYHAVTEVLDGNRYSIVFVFREVA